MVQAIALAGTFIVVTIVGYLEWRAWLRYLEDAANQGRLDDAAKAARKFPRKSLAGLAAGLLKALLKALK